MRQTISDKNIKSGCLYMDKVTNELSIIGRTQGLFEQDLRDSEEAIQAIVTSSRFLIVGGAGTIGQAVTKQIFKRSPKVLHVVDLSENNLVELVRDLRSEQGYISGDFRTFALDAGSRYFYDMIEQNGPYDYIFNLSAMKHVRSERDAFTLMRLIETNVINTVRLAKVAQRMGCKKYFCVSTDKAANPVNMMGASKRIMEILLGNEAGEMPVSMARFANVAFSDGSLLHGFRNRMLKRQPISAPLDVKRYFISETESGELCLLAGLIGKDKEIFFPKETLNLTLTTFAEIARRFLLSRNLQPRVYPSEHEARLAAMSDDFGNTWPCYFFESDTTGEKDFEEFYTSAEDIDWTRLANIGVVMNNEFYSDITLDQFETGVNAAAEGEHGIKEKLVEIFQSILPNFEHAEMGRNLDQKM